MALNLLANAVNFTPAGRRIDPGIVRGDDGAVAMRIADQGTGIASDQLELVMQPFGHVAEVAARDHQGTGLGLPLTSRFLQLHGGRLELRSERGAGTTALAWLPAARVRQSESRLAS